jgi:hypothetical protein
VPLGDRLTPEEILPGVDKLRAVRDSKPPALSRKSSNLLASQFFQYHVRHFATTSAPLNRLASIEANWYGGKLTENCTEAFN